MICFSASEAAASLELPIQWVWDIIDEFIYQFQEFCQYRSKLKNKSPDEIAKLKSNPHVCCVNIHFMSRITVFKISLRN
jgi:hypothetical protein